MDCVSIFPSTVLLLQKFKATRKQAFDSASVTFKKRYWPAN